MKRIILLALLAVGLTAGAQHLNEYTLSIETATAYQSIATTGTRLTNLNGTGSGMNYQQNITLPFDLEYGPMTLLQGSRIAVCSSGRIAMGSGAYCYSNGNNPWNSPDNDEYSVWPFICGGRGHLPNNTGACYYQTMSDVDGGQMLVIEWKGMRREGCTGDNINYQLRLHSNGDISVHYGNITIDTTWFDSLFSFMIIAGNASDGYCPGTGNVNYIDRQMLTGTWNSLVQTYCIQLPGQLYGGTSFASGTGHHVVGVPSNGLLLTYQRPLPPCPHPTHLTVGDVTTSMATLHWDGNGVPGAAYMVEYDTVSFTPGGGTHNATLVNDTTCTLYGLLSDHTYYFYLRGHCGSDTSDWQSISFITPCEAMSHADLPYSQDFNSGVSSTPQPCWRKLGDVYFHTGSGSGANRIYFCNISNLGCYSIAPPVENVQGVNVTFRVWGGPVAVGVMDSPYDTASFDTVSVLWANAADWYEYSVGFRGYTGSGMYIAFTASPNQYGVGGCRIDDVLINTISGCQPVEHLEASNLTATSATISWYDPDSNTYRVSWWNANSVSPDTLTTTDHSVNLTGLLTDINYYISVSSICGADSTSTADTISIHLVCVQPTRVNVDSITGHTAAVSWVEPNDEVATYRITLTTGDSTVVLQDTVSALSYALTGLSSRTRYTVGVSRLCDSSWTGETTAAFTTDYACGAVDSVTVSGVTETSALITIHDADSAGSYCVTVARGSSADTFYISTYTLPLTLLEANSHYTVRVATVCASDNSFSPWVSSGFDTPCSIITHADLPYVEDFENCVAGDKNTLNPCWTYRSFAPSNYVGMYKPVANPSGTGLCLYGYPRNAQEPFFLALPEVDSLDDLSLRFWVYITWVGDTKVDVGVMADPTDTTTFTTLYTYIPSVRNQWTEVEVDLGAYTGSGRHPALRYGVVTTNTGDPVYIDDVELFVGLSCRQPDSLYATDITDSSATLVIVPSAEGDAAASYMVVVSSDATSDTIVTTSLSVPLTGLDWSTEYTIGVRSICADGGITMPAATSFTTLCGLRPLPYLEGFENERRFHLPRCWEQLDGGGMLDVRSIVGTVSGTQVLFASIGSNDSSMTFATPELQPYDGPVGISMLMRLYSLKYVALSHTDTLPVTFEMGVLTDSLHIFYSQKLLLPEWDIFDTVAGNLLTNGGRLVIRIARIDDSVTTTQLCMDDIAIAPRCVPVAALEVVSVDTIPEGLEAYWQPQGREQQWEVTVWNDAAEHTVIVNQPMLNITAIAGLDDSTEYNIAVRPICSEGDTGAWGDTVSFTTPMPYNPEGIDGATICDARLWPNPASGHVVVSCAADSWRLTVVDMNGRRMLAKDVSGNTLRLNLDGWAAGQYIVTIDTPQGRVVNRLVVIND